MLIVRQLHRRAYTPVWQEMTQFTDTRVENTPDELWVVEHDPVYTQGQAGKSEHVIQISDDIPIVQSDRGGQVTYHGPGQLVVYPLLNMRNLGIGVRDLVSLIEASVIDVLALYKVESKARPDAPGVYVNDAKIASLGLRVRRGCSFHGVAINVDMDLSPFKGINPCGYARLAMTQLKEWIDTDQQSNHTALNDSFSFEQFSQEYVKILAAKLGYNKIEYA